MPAGRIRGPGRQAHARLALSRGLAAGLVASAVALITAGAQTPPSQEALPPTALPIRLTGILFDRGQPARCACLIQCVAQPQRRGIFSVNERACDVAEIREIRDDAVVIENLEAKRLELLTFPASTSPPAAPSRPAAAPGPATPLQPEPVSIGLPNETVQTAVANLPELLSSALAAPRYVEAPGGQRSIEGFLVTQVRPSGAAERLGLRNGDVILDVNGQLLDGMATVMRLFGELQTAPQVAITVLRDGRRLSVVVNTK